MKKQNVCKFLYIISALLLLGFFIRLGVDYSSYKFYSAPFYFYFIIRVIEFIVPSSIIFAIAKITEKRNKS